MSQGKLARKLGVHRLRYWAIENGELEPSRDEQEAIAAAFGVRVSDIAWPDAQRAVSA
jgi:DNA-binding XRE family transcriptional regulator